MDELIRLGVTGILSDLPAELDRLLTDIDAKRLAAAAEQVDALAAALTRDRSAHDRDYASVAPARAALRRAEADLRAGKAREGLQAAGPRRPAPGRVEGRAAGPRGLRLGRPRGASRPGLRGGLTVSATTTGPGGTAPARPGARP
jgi:hypothetical protein